MIHKITKEQQKEILIKRVEKILKTLPVNGPNNSKLYTIYYRLEEELNVLKEICKEKELEFGETAEGWDTSPQTYKGFIIQ